MQSIELSQPRAVQPEIATSESQHTVRVVILIALLFLVGLITCLPSIF